MVKENAEEIVRRIGWFWLFRYATVEKMLWLWFSFICMLGAMKLEDCTPLDFSSFSLVLDTHP